MTYVSPKLIHPLNTGLLDGLERSVTEKKKNVSNQINFTCPRVALDTFES